MPTSERSEQQAAEYGPIRFGYLPLCGAGAECVKPGCLNAHGPMRVAYADPPYLGCCRLYDHYHPDGLCWDDPATHRKLIDRLTSEFPDGWALSCHTPSLVTLLPMCPDDVRIGAWVKPFHAYKKGVRPAYAWEPIIYRGGRNKKPSAPPKGGKAITPKDFISCNITLRKGLTGAKPEPVCDWILDLLNVLPGDEVVDLFTGSGVMGRVAERRFSPASTHEGS